jgi:heme-degrading monooxygenase HmoA
MSVAVIFWARRRTAYDEEYLAASARMIELASQQPGYVDYVSVFDSQTREGATISFFTDEAAALAWKAHPEHLVAQRDGIENYYDEYRIWVAEVSRDYSFRRSSDGE